MRVQSLLDVNVLVALFWPQHGKHQAAKEWFQNQVDVSWPEALRLSGAAIDGFQQVD